MNRYRAAGGGQQEAMWERYRAFMRRFRFLGLRLTVVESCKTCGHLSSAHVGFSGPNSIGQWSFKECVVGCKTVGPYRFGGCQCSAYRKKRRLALWKD